MWSLFFEDLEKPDLEDNPSCLELEPRRSDRLDNLSELLENLEEFSLRSPTAAVDGVKNGLLSCEGGRGEESLLLFTSRADDDVDVDVDTGRTEELLSNEGDGNLE